MLLSLITNDSDLALAAEQCGVERILVDLERRGKAERQAGHKLFLSDHQIEDVERLARALRKTELVVRVNPWHPESEQEIEEVIAKGADCIMLPYFHTTAEVASFLSLVQGRVTPILLVETAEAAQNIEGFLAFKEKTEFHIGLNDLSLSHGQNTIFPILCDGTVHRLAERLHQSQATFGIGGISRLSHPDLPIDPEAMVAFQVLQGATRGWLGRTFRQIFEENQETGLLKHEISRLRDCITYWQEAPLTEEEAMNRLFLQYAQEATQRYAVSAH